MGYKELNVFSALKQPVGYLVSFILFFTLSCSAYSEREKNRLYDSFKEYRSAENVEDRLKYFSSGFLKDYLETLLVSEDVNSLLHNKKVVLKAINSGDYVKAVHSVDESIDNSEGVLELLFSNPDMDVLEAFKLELYYVVDSSGRWLIDGIKKEYVSGRYSRPADVLDEFEY